MANILNTFYTNVDIDSLYLDDEDLSKVKKFKNQILENPEDYKLFDDIFFNEIKKMDIYDIIKNIEVIGGSGKKLAIEDIIKRDSIDVGEILYIGDSITDVEPLQFARENNGISISFNGNEYPLKVAEIAVVSSSAITTALIANIYSNNDKKTVLKFIEDYNTCTDKNELFEKYCVDLNIKNKFFDVFDKSFPLIRIINDDNFDEILKLSTDMRNNIRGEDIGGLG